jgi:hypothetical protein
VRGHQDDRQGRVEAPTLAQQLDAVHAVHAEVGHDRGHGLVLKCTDHRLWTLETPHAVASILEELGEELGCAEQARLASMAGGRRAAIATHYAAGRHDDERHEALAMVASAASTADLAAAGAIMRRMVLSAASRAAVAEAYKLRRSQLAA